MSAFRIDGLLTTAQVQGGARKSFPFEGDVSSFIVEQDYMVNLANYSPLALSTAHGTYTSAYLVRESALENLGAGVVKFTRTYAQIPASRSEYGTFAYEFIGFLGVGTPPYSQYDVQVGDQRDPFLKVVVSRFLHEYFLCAPGQTYVTPDLIPVVPAQVYSFDGLPNNKAKYLVDAATNPLASQTDPTLPDYRTLVTNEDEIVAEDSTIERWMGDIYVRSTRYVKAL
jgi:hypothetical protein